MFTLTPSAAQRPLAAHQRSDTAGLALRGAVRQAAEGTIEYGVGLDEERANDLPAPFPGPTELQQGRLLLRLRLRQVRLMLHRRTAPAGPPRRAPVPSWSPP